MWVFQWAEILQQLLPARLLNEEERVLADERGKESVVGEMVKRTNSLLVFFSYGVLRCMWVKTVVVDIYLWSYSQGLHRGGK